MYSDLHVTISVHTTGHTLLHMHPLRKKEKNRKKKFSNYYVLVHVTRNAKDRTMEGKTKHKRQNKTKKTKALSPVHKAAH